MSQSNTVLSSDLVLLHSVVKMPLMELPVTTPVVRLSGGNILISPGSQLNRENLRELKVVTDIVANNLFHHAGVPKAASIFPDSKLWAVPGLEKKRSDIRWTHFFNKDNWPYADELPFVMLEGISKVNEVVFFHKKSKTLIVSDLCFNLLNQTGWGPRIILSLFGTYNKFGVSKFFVRFIDNKVAFKNSINKILEFDFEKIVMGHGATIETNGKNLLINSLKERKVITD